MNIPEPLKPEHLQHPKGKVKAWNGEMRKPRSNRFNGEPDMEDRGFTTRGITVTHGSQPPSNVKPARGRPGMPAAPPRVETTDEVMSRALQSETPDPTSEVEKPRGSAFEHAAGFL